MKGKVAHLPLRDPVISLDPADTRGMNDAEVQGQIYEGLYTYKYLVRPYQIEPLLATDLPRVSEDGLTYTIDIKKGVLFHDDACFEGGRGRELVAQDFVYSFKRLGGIDTSGGGWLFHSRIVGYDDFMQKMRDRRDGSFELDAPLEGLQATGKHQLQLKLVRPYPPIVHLLAMSLSFVVPRECAVHYGVEFANHAVGTGPFRLRSRTQGEIVLEKNPSFRELLFPSESSPEFRHLLGDAGKKVPFLDGIVFHIYERDDPMWEEFMEGKLDLTQVPAQKHVATFKPDRSLDDSLIAKGIENYELTLVDFVYRGFNMADPVVGQGEQAKYLRQAISLAFDAVMFNKLFYNSTAVLYDAPVPPGLSSHVSGVSSPYRGLDLDKARALMVKAGYPNGKGLPVLRYETTGMGGRAKQAEMLKEAVAKIGIKLDVSVISFAEFHTKLKKRDAQIFASAWGADFPDAENFLQLFYGPNAAPGSNDFNHISPAYDALYEQSLALQPGPQRAAVYQKMRELLIEAVPSFGHMARVRSYLWHSRLKNVLPDEVHSGWRKHLDLRQ